MTSEIIKVEVSVISRSVRLALITLTETLIIPNITKKKQNLIVVLLYIVLKEKQRIVERPCFYFRSV